MVELTQRPRYFDRQLLGVADFTLAQGYDLTRRRLHNRLHHTWGIADGLALSFVAQGTRATVSPGSALDNLGREIVLAAAATTPSISAYPGKAVYVTIAYAEADTDPRTSNGITDYSRTTETPTIQVSDAAPPNPGAQLILGRLTVSATGTITAVDEGVDPNRRRAAGIAGGSLVVDQTGTNNGTLNPGLVFGGVTGGEGLASKRTSGGNQYGLDVYTGGTARLSITNAGSIGIGTPTPAARLHVRSGRLRVSESDGPGGSGVLELANAAKTNVVFTDGGAGHLHLRTDSPSYHVLLQTGGTQGNVGVGVPAPSARLSIAASGAGELPGLAHSAALRTSAGVLGVTATNELALASIGFQSTNGSALGVRAIRVANGSDWTTTAIGLGMDVDNTIRVNGSALFLHANGNIGVGTSAPTRARLEVAGKVGTTVASLGQGDTGISLTVSWPGVGFNGYCGTVWRAMAAGYSGVIHLDPGAGAFRFYTGTSATASDQAVTMTERLTIDNAGNVGLGTSAPQGRLHIANGDLRLDGGHTISAGGRLHIAGDEILYLLNRSGVIVSRAGGGSGDLTVESRIGVNGQSPVPRTSGWAGGIHTWDLEVEGSAWCRNGWASGARDMAENFEAEVVLEAGEVVSFHPEHDMVVRSAVPNDARICGVVSTDPGVLLNVDPDRLDQKVRVPIALCGRVPCRVVDETGPIHRGDLLTSSSVPGYAMRAEPLEIDGEPVYRAGTIIGKALTPHTQGQGMIDIFVSPR
jgi:hypothetical protein